MGRIAIRPRAQREAWLFVGFVIWAALVVGSLAWLTAYSFAPGGLAAPPPLSAAGLPFAPQPNTYLTVIAVHPKCPCSRASVGELARLLTWHKNGRRANEMQCAVLAFRPQAEPIGWSATDMVQTTRDWPHTHVIDDVDGRLARRLGMTTSGSVILFSPRGEATYWGGITASRGHSGDNIGIDAMRAILSGNEPLRRTAPVFGCNIWETNDINES